MKKYFVVSVSSSLLVSVLMGFIYKYYSADFLISYQRMPKDQFERRMEIINASHTFFELGSVYDFNWTVACFTLFLLVVFLYVLSRTIYYDKLVKIFKN